MEKALSEINKPGTHLVKKIVGDDSVRILEMGITPGIELQIIRRAPLGYPMEIKVRGYLLSLRKTEADCILVER